MEDIIELIYAGFSDRKFTTDLEYKKLMDEVVDAENKLTETFTAEQQELYRAFMQANDEIVIESYHELIKYMLKMISQIFNYQQKK